jgi:TatD DNase family protein
MLVDTHCHLDFDSFDGDLVQVITRASEAGVTKIITPSLGLDNCDKVLRISGQYDSVFAAVGIHPNYSANWQESWVEELQVLAGGAGVLAIGEIGLDYYRDYSPKQRQIEVLETQLELAAAVDLPVILHNRDSDADLISILSQTPISRRPNPGVLHAYSSPWETAEAALELGYYLGIGGPVTYKNSGDLRKVVARIPLDRLLVETDAPFLAPQQYRGKRNEPAYVASTAREIAALREMEFEEFAWQTTENAIRLFGEALRDA